MEDIAVGLICGWLKSTEGLLGDIAREERPLMEDFYETGLFLKAHRRGDIGLETLKPAGFLGGTDLWIGDM